MVAPGTGREVGEGPEAGVTFSFVRTRGERDVREMPELRAADRRLAE